MISKAKYLFYCLSFALLYFMTAEILLRRLVWKQIPTPLPGFFVYLLILLNLALLPYLMKPVLRRLAGGKKPGRN